MDDRAFHEQGFPEAYALDGLDGDERRAFAAHLAGCATCRADVAAARAVAAQLPLALDDAEPSPALRARILGAIAEDRAADTAGASAPAPLPLPLGARRRLPQAYAVAAVLLLTLGLGLLGWNLSLQRQVREAAAERDQARAALAAERAQPRATVATWTLAPTGGQPGSGQVLYMREHQQAIVTISGLPPLQPGQVYQIWLIQNDRPEGAGVLQAPSGEMAMQADMMRYQQIAITAEPGPNGSPQPTSQPLLAGTVGQ